MSTVMTIGNAMSYAALAIGGLFFLFACKYYLSILIALFIGKNGTKNGNPGADTIDGGEEARLFEETTGPEGEPEEPFVSIHLPFYNERNVASRILEACLELDYGNYEILVADDSRDETIDILKEYGRRPDGPAIKVVHRGDRSGFKGGALQEAAESMDPRAEYIVVLDADFIPSPDILRKFLWYFEGSGLKPSSENHRFSEDVLNHYSNSVGDSEKICERVDDWYERRRIGVVQGYQLHLLNKNENWITKGIRCEFSGGYMIERVSEEFFGAMKMITGSVFMIRAEIVRRLGWTHSITEDWDLTLRMYLEGYKVLYTPLIQAPAEIPTTIRAVARQRMRWAEGHTFAVKKHFREIMASQKLSLREKLEFLYFSPYYLQSLLFLVGTTLWLGAEAIGAHPPFWTAVLGWSLILSNLFALPLMSLAGLYLERSAIDDFSGIFSMLVLSYTITPFQAYAAVKGLLEKDEGGWVRTYKTGSITDRILQLRLRRLFDWIIPEREPPLSARRRKERRNRKPSTAVLALLLLMSTFIVWVTASARTISDVEAPTTALTMEYIPEPVEINGIATNMILTHPDYTSPGPGRTDRHVAIPDHWAKAWGFALYGPLEAVYKLKWGLKAHLCLYSDQQGEVDVRIKVLQLDERGRVKRVIDHVFEGVELGDQAPDEPIELFIDTHRAKRFDAGDSIIVEIWFRSTGESRRFYIEYDSVDTPSRVEFPGIVMPEGLMPVLLVAPFIPAIVKWFLRSRGDDPSQEEIALR